MGKAIRLGGSTVQARVPANGSFEELSGGVPLYWTLTGSWATSSAASEDGALSIACTSAGTATTSPRPAVDAGRLYRVSCWVKCAAGASLVFLLRYRCFDAGGSAIGASTTLFGLGSFVSSSWTEISGTFTAKSLAAGDPADAADVAIILSVSISDGTPLYVDNVVLTPAMLAGDLPIAAPLALDTTGFNITIAALGITNSYIGNAAVTANKTNLDALDNSVGALKANYVVDNMVSPNAFTKIFTGDVIFSRGSANPVLKISNTGMYLYGVASGSTGLTSSPYVSVISTGILIAQKSNGVGVYIDGGTGSINLYSDVSNLVTPVSPYVSMDVNSLTMKSKVSSGNYFQMTLSSAQLKMEYMIGASSSISSTLNAAGWTLLNGAGVLSVTATNLMIGRIGGIALTTLNANITSTGATTMTVNSGTVFMNGTYLQIGTEIISVVSGAGTSGISTVTIARAQLGSAATTHSAGNDVLAYNLFTVDAFGLLILGPLSSVYCSSSGVTIVGGILTAPAINGGAINGTTLTLTSGGITTTINNATTWGTANGLVTSDGSYSSAISPTGINVIAPDGGIDMWTSILSNSPSPGYYGVITIQDNDLAGGAASGYLRMRPKFATTANVGSGGAVPATVEGFLVWHFHLPGGSGVPVTIKIPYFLN